MHRDTGRTLLARKPPTRRDGQAKLESIIHTTTILLATYSLAGLTMTLIAAETDIPRTTIYGFFPTIGGLIEVIARREINASWNYVRAQIRRHAPDNLSALLLINIDASVRYINTHPAVRRTIMGGGAFELHSLENNYDIMGATLYREFCDPQWPIEPLSEEDPFRTIVLLQTAIFSSSVKRHDRITAVMASQAKIVAQRFFSPLIAELGEPRLKFS